MLFGAMAKEDTYVATRILLYWPRPILNIMSVDTEKFLTDVEIGDIICYVENYNHDYKRNTYGLVLDSRLSNKKRQLKIRWFEDTYRDSWHPDPSDTPKYRIKQFYVVSKAKRKENENRN